MKNKKIKILVSCILAISTMGNIAPLNVYASENIANIEVEGLDDFDTNTEAETEKILPDKIENEKIEIDYELDVTEEIIENETIKKDVNSEDEIKTIANNISEGWSYEDGKWYYYDNEGKMKTGWIRVGEKDYFMNENGVMSTAQWIGEYYVGADGACVYNQWVGNYYCNADGRYARNQWVGEYYCNADGRYARNQWAGEYYCNADGRYAKNQWVGEYYCNADGRYARNQWVGDYYCNADGRYARNQWIGDYYCIADGRYARNTWVQQSNKWYYCNTDGRFIKGDINNSSVKIGDNEYIFNMDGSMKSDEWINDIFVKLDGRVVRVELKDTNSSTQYKMFKYMSNFTNRENVHNRAIQLHNGITNNNCVYFTSELLRRVGVNIPEKIAYTTKLEAELKNRGWKRKTDLNALKPGDIVFAGVEHAYTFMGWAEDGQAYIVDNQKDKFGAVLHKRNVFKDSDKDDTYKSTHFYTL